MNNAELDPYLDRPIPNQQPMEIQGEYISNEWEQELDDYSKEYHPFQEIVPDTQTGFSLNGDYHAVESFTLEGLGSAITPHRWCQYLQDALTQYVSNFEYTVGASERDDIVQDLVSERMECLDSMLERYQLEKALEIWRTSYGRGYKLQK